MSRENLKPFCFALLGALVGAAAVKSLDRPATAAAGDRPESFAAGVIYAKRIVVAGEASFPNVMIEDGRVVIQRSDELGEAVLTQESLQLQNKKAKRTLLIDADAGGIGRAGDKGDAEAVFKTVR